MESADLGTLHQDNYSPRPPLGTDRRGCKAAASGNKQGVTESLEEEEETGVELERGGAFRRRKRMGVGRGGQTVKARASSPELSVGSPASGYRAV